MRASLVGRRRCWSVGMVRWWVVRVWCVRGVVTIRGMGIRGIGGSGVSVWVGWRLIFISAVRGIASWGERDGSAAAGCVLDGESGVWGSGEVVCGGVAV